MKDGPLVRGLTLYYLLVFAAASSCLDSARGSFCAVVSMRSPMTSEHSGDYLQIYAPPTDWIYRAVSFRLLPRQGISCLGLSQSGATGIAPARNARKETRRFRYRGSGGVEPATHSRARSRSSSRSRVLRVSDAARSNSELAS